MACLIWNRPWVLSGVKQENVPEMRVLGTDGATVDRQRRAPQALNSRLAIGCGNREGRPTVAVAGYGTRASQRRVRPRMIASRPSPANPSARRRRSSLGGFSSTTRLPAISATRRYGRLGGFSGALPTRSVAGRRCPPLNGQHHHETGDHKRLDDFAVSRSSRSPPPRRRAGQRAGCRGARPGLQHDDRQVAKDAGPEQTRRGTPRSKVNA